MKFTICGNYGAGNLGDEMILSGLISFLKETYNEIEITVLSGDPKKTATKDIHSVEKFPAGIKSLLKFPFSKSKTKEEFSSSDYFILGGGGLFVN